MNKSGASLEVLDSLDNGIGDQKGEDGRLEQLFRVDFILKVRSRQAEDSAFGRIAPNSQVFAQYPFVEFSFEARLGQAAPFALRPQRASSVMYNNCDS